LDYDKHHYNGVDVELLPYKEPISCRRDWDSRWRRRDRLFVQQHRLLIRILDSRIGKSVDKAFSYWSKVCHPMHKNLFKKEFYVENRRWPGDYYVENGLIFKRKKKYKKLTLEYHSEDCTYKKVFKESGKYLSVNYTKGQPVINEWFFSKEILTEHCETILVNGVHKVFERRRDPEFLRLKAEKNKRIIRREKEWRKQRQEKYDNTVIRKFVQPLFL